jgi:predicted acetyltransferase
LKLRGYREEDRGEVARVAAGALGGSVEGWEEKYVSEKNPRLDPEQVYVVEEDGGIRATAAVLPLEVFVDGEPVTMGGIADVATHAACRRRGYAAELMRAALGGCGSGVSTSRCSILSPTSSTAAMAGNSLPKP